MTDPIPTLPTGPLDLLVRAALAPPHIAQESWQSWRQGYTLDETPWNEVRLLGAVAERVGWLEPEAEILPRMKGIQKFLYAQTQMCLTSCASALKALADAGIPIMLIKGAARVAADGRVARERLVRDLDVLVPLDRAAQAFSILQAANWTFQNNGGWQSFWHKLDSIANHHAWSLAKGGAELDLHHFSNSLNRLADDDRGLWQRARPVEWRGLSVVVPSPEDSLILSIVHGLRWSRECNADWIIDACTCLNAAPVDWQIVLDETQRRQLDAIMLTGLRYMKQAVHAAIPEDVLNTLAERAVPLQWAELDAYARAPMPRTPEQNRPLLAMAVERCGPRSAAPGPRRRWLHRLNAPYLPLRASIRVENIAPGEETADVIVRVHSKVHPQTRLVGTLCIVGLVLDVRYGVPCEGMPNGANHAFSFSFPRRLLDRRNVTNICLSIEREETFIYPPWTHSFRSGEE